MLQAIGWLAATILLLFVEASTFNLVSVWFAVGGAAALISCFFTDSFQVQAVIFIVVSILCLLAFRPLTRKLRKPAVPINADKLNIGRTATVLTGVSDAASGRVRLDGVDWNAQAVPGAAFAPGDSCRIVEIRSTLLIVEPLASPLEAPVEPHT